MSDRKKSVLITGAAGGIGRAAAERLARNGWRVVAVDRDAEKLAWSKAAEGIESFVADITSEQANADMVAFAERTHGGLDAIILNAAITMGGGIDDVSMAMFQQAIAVNLLGPVMGVKAALPALRRRGGGSILITSSMHGLSGEISNWAYVATKHAVVGLVKALSRDHGWEGIRINAICPGLTRQTGMTSDIEAHAGAAFQGLASTVPLQRWGEPDEMAAVMEFLISPAASYVNGVAMPVDGGASTGSGLVGPARGPSA